MKPRSRFAAVFLGMALLAGGCKDKPADDTAAIQKSLEEKGTVDLMDQVAKSPEYVPPSDGRLTDGQMRMYVDVRGREQKIRGTAMASLQAKDEENRGKGAGGLLGTVKAMGDLADVATADLRAAVELGFNPKEYQWVKDRVMEAQMLQATQALNLQVARSQESLLAVLEKQRQEASTDEERKDLDQRIRELREQAAQAPADMTPAKAYNAEVVARYKADLERLREEDRRIAQELEKRGSNASR